MMKYFVIFIILLCSACHTIEIENARAVLEPDSHALKDFKMNAKTNLYGFSTSDASRVMNPCEGSSWVKVRVTESSEDVRDTAVRNAGYGAGSLFFLGAGAMVCAAHSKGFSGPICWAGVTGMVYGALTLLTLPLMHVAPNETSSTVVWQCAS